MVGAKADAITAHGGAGVLIQRLDLIGHVAAEQDAEIFNQLEGQTFGETLQIFGARNIVERLQNRCDLVIDEALDAGERVVTRIAAQLLVGQKDDARLHDVVAGGQTRHGLTEPADETVRAHRQVAITTGMETGGARLVLQCERLLRCRLDGLGIWTFGSRNRGEPESRQLTDMMSFYEDITIHTDFSFKHRILS